MDWKDQHVNPRDPRSLLEATRRCATREEAREFMRQLRRVYPWAYQDVGYLTGYVDEAERARFREWFGVAHPITGLADDIDDAEKLVLGIGIGQYVDARVAPAWHNWLTTGGHRVADDDWIKRHRNE